MSRGAINVHDIESVRSGSERYDVYLPMSNRIAFVTGAARGIGRACAVALSGAGFRVGCGDRETAGLEETANEIRSRGDEAYVVAMDLSSPDSIKEALARTAKEFGRVDVLVNNAGITKDGLAMRMKKEDWDAVIGINLTGTFLCTQQVIPGMLKERWGRIINIASVVGQSGNPGQANYVSSKAGVIGLTKCLAQELGSRNITVNAVAPGYIDTPMTAGLPQDVKDAMMAKIPLARLGKPEDIAAAVRFLASDDASYVTGQVLGVNGGMYM
jgi:3-oxoacyl-[acyl-carrier protein] reductase